MPSAEPLVHRRERLVGAAVPDDDPTCTVLPLGDDALEAAEFEGMVIDLDGETLVGGVHRGTFGDSPGLEDDADFEAEVPVKVSGVVFLDNEAEHPLPRLSAWSGFCLQLPPSQPLTSDGTN